MNAAIWVAIIGGLFSIATMLYDKRDQAWTINIAILAEVKRLLAVIRMHKEWWERQRKKRDTNLPLIPFSTPIFDGREQDLGQLDAEIVEQVVRFYGAVKYINSFQAARPCFPEGKHDDFEEQYSDILATVFETYGPKFDCVFERYGIKIRSKPVRRDQECRPRLKPVVPDESEA